MKSRYFILIILIISLTILINIVDLVNANFVCGEVMDSKENMSATWYSVNLYYPDFLNKTQCVISPAGNKYCCDTESIIGRNWKAGDILTVDVFDNQGGYVAGPVYVKTSSEGYDIASQMQLHKVIDRREPKKRLIISNLSFFNLDVDFINPYNNAYIQIGDNKEILCNGCNNYNGEINCSYGMNKIILFAQDNKNSFSDEFDIALLRNINLTKTAICDGCDNFNIKNNQNVTIEIILNLSDNIDYLTYIEYVPIDFLIIDSGFGILKSYSKTHNILVYNISGKDIKLQYKIISPDIFVFPKRFTFKSELEDIILNEENYTVFNIINLFAIDSSLDLTKLDEISNKIYSRITPERPLVIRPNNSIIERIVVFPKVNQSDIRFSLIKNENSILENEIVSYELDGDLDKEDIDKILIELKIEKSYMILNGYTNINIFLDKTLNENDLELYNNDSRYNYYRVILPYSKNISFNGVKDKKNIFQALLDLLS
ncbi:MAG: hypothetical protein WC867_06310 [Candidatus Pacearchaeota archaeon]